MAPGPIVLAALVAAAAVSADAVRTFDSDPAGRPPPGFSFRVTRDQSAARWLVQREGANGFLAHLGDGSARDGFSLAVVDGASTDAAISVSARTRLVGGHGSIGVLWRVQDRDNYYLARLDLSRQDIGLYRVVQGNRVRIDGEDDLELDTNAWHTLKIVQEDETIRVYLGGIRVLRVRDRTFRQSGQAGVWCTGDAVAHFDDVRIGTGERKGGKDEGPRR
jgi:hypothetical protein